MSRQAEMRACLIAHDVEQFRQINAAAFPHLPQPESREMAEAAMHHATTQTASLPLAPRAYSHRWLCERNLPSALPDELKAKAERLYPHVVDAVWIGSMFNRPWTPLLRHAAEGAVLELHGDGVDLDKQAPFVKQRMFEARERETKALFGDRDTSRVAASLKAKGELEQ